jgi:alpha-L-fucosidase 2
MKMNFVHRKFNQVFAVVLVVFFHCANLSRANTFEGWEKVARSNDLVWASVDSNFYNGAFIGDGIQGAMVMQDNKNPNGIRMLMGHYKAIAHHSISGWEYCDSRVYVGNIVVKPKGNTHAQSMRLNIFDGEASGTILTDLGQVKWNAVSDRKNNVFMVTMITNQSENGAVLGVREEWSITPRIYLENKDVNNYLAHVPPKPVSGKQDDVDIITNKKISRGAHVVASKLVKVSDTLQVLYVAIGVDDNNDRELAATNAANDAVARVKTAVGEGYENIKTRNKEWWNQYMGLSLLRIDEDHYWQKFWWLQMYKFGCASSQNSAFLMDTQGPWIWETAWAGVWWNLNVQLSYFPMFSGNRLDAGKSLVNGLDRLYQSGALAQNAGGKGIYIGRSSTYEGKATWGDELGNLPWILHCYWKYWKYSGNDDIGRALFPMLKDNMEYLATKLEKQSDGKYHLKNSRSPEYSDAELFPDANYGLMSIDWVLKTLLEMDTYLGFNDTKRAVWQELHDNLVFFPTGSDGFMVGSNQGFDKGHRHYSHLLAIYPYHTINPENGYEEVTKKSVDRWLSLTEKSGNAGYTYTGGCAMRAVLGDGNEALRLLNKLKTDKLQPNTMYAEGGGPVIETPLSGVESINYLLLQSWNGVIRVFPAIPDKWKNVSFEKLRTEGAFLVSATMENGNFDAFTVFSEKGNICTLKNPWEGKGLVIKDENGNPVVPVVDSILYSFPTDAGKSYAIERIKAPKYKYAYVKDNAKEVQVVLTEKTEMDTLATGFLLVANNTDTLVVDSVQSRVGSDTLVVFLKDALANDDEATISYHSGNVVSVYGKALEHFEKATIDNLLPGSPPRLVQALTNSKGSAVGIKFNKALLQPVTLADSFKLKVNAGFREIAKWGWSVSNPDSMILYLDQWVVNSDNIAFSYNDTSLTGADGGLVKPISNFQVVNKGPGQSPILKEGTVSENGKAIQLTFSKVINHIQEKKDFFEVKIDGQPAHISFVTPGFENDAAVLAIQEKVKPNQTVTVGFSGDTLFAHDGGMLTLIDAFEVNNPLIRVYHVKYIKDVKISTSSLNFKVDSAYVGQLIYTDRSYNFTDMHDSVAGGEVLIWENGLKSTYSESLISFTAGSDGVVYVAHDDRLAKPDWLLTGFVSSGYKVTINDTKGTLFFKEYMKDDKVILGANQIQGSETGGSTNYIVFFKPRKVTPPIGINTSYKNLSTAFPNPANGFVTVEMTCDGAFSISLTDMAGREVYSENGFGRGQRINLDPFLDGIYYLTVQTNQSKDVHKLLIHK